MSIAIDNPDLADRPRNRMPTCKENFTFVWHPANRNKEKNLSVTDVLDLFDTQTPQLRDIIYTLFPDPLPVKQLELFDQDNLLEPENKLESDRTTESN